MSPINHVDGDLLTMKTDYIAHQCNCRTRKSAGLSSHVFKRYPYANTYKSRYKRIPGTISVHNGPGTDFQGVINMYSQDHPGKTGNETKKQRLAWLDNCLDALKEIEDLTSISFPYNFGCGMAGGVWVDYLKKFEDFAEKFPKIKVYIVRKV